MQPDLALGVVVSGGVGQFIGSAQGVAVAL